MQNISPEERALIFFSRWANGYRIIEKKIKNYSHVKIEKLISKFEEDSSNWGKHQYSNLDITWLARMANATGNLFQNDLGCKNCGCEFLLPFYTYLDDVALNSYIREHSKTEEDLKKFNTKSEEQFRRFKYLWECTPKELAHIEADRDRLDFHTKIQNLVLLPNGMPKQISTNQHKISDEDFWKNLKMMIVKVYIESQRNIIKNNPWKEKKLDKPELWDVEMWTGQKFVGLTIEKVNKLLADNRYKFRMDDYEKPVKIGDRDPIADELHNKKIIRSMSMIQHKQKSVSKNLYCRQIQGISMISTLIRLQFIYIGMFLNEDTHMKDNYWIGMHPTICKFHCTPYITKIKPFLGEKITDKWGKFIKNNLETYDDCKDLFKRIVQKLKIDEDTKVKMDYLIKSSVK